jgi:toxin ParE1/3/4
VALILSNAADVDIADIAAYTIETWGIAQADIYSEGLIDAMNGLVAVPKMLAPAADLPFLLCRVRYKSHYIYYRIERADVVVARILHKRMDPMRHLS